MVFSGAAGQTAFLQFSTATAVIEVDTGSPGQDKSGHLTLQDRPLLAALVNAIKELSRKLTTLADTIASFAETFTTKELSFERAVGDELTLNKLCLGQVCVTETEFMAVFSPAAAPNLPESVPSSPSNIRAAPVQNPLAPRPVSVAAALVLFSPLLFHLVQCWAG